MPCYGSLCEAYHAGRGLLLAMSRSSAARELARYERRWRVCSMVFTASEVRDVMIGGFCWIIRRGVFPNVEFLRLKR